MMRLESCHIVLAVCLLFLPGCSREDKPLAVMRELVPVELAMSMQTPPPPSGTKADVSYYRELANDARFRGMKQVRVFSFEGQHAVTASDPVLSEPRRLPDIAGRMDAAAYSGNVYHTGLVENNNAHLYSDAYAILPAGTGSVLVYGRAPIAGDNLTRQEKHFNGSLIESEWEGRKDFSAAEMTFTPEPIFSGDHLDTALEMAGILTDIVGAATYIQPYYFKRNEVWYESQTSVVWNNSIEDATLRSLFDWFTNEGQLMTGAGSNLEYMLTELYRRLQNYEPEEDDPFIHLAGGVEYPAVLEEGNEESVFTRATLYDGLRNMLIARIDALVAEGRLADDGSHNISFVDETMRTYPSSLGIPDGGAVLRWNSVSFTPVTEGLDGIAPLDHFCYMPPLYYYTNTTIKTSDSHYVYEYYTPDMTWDQIVGTYRLGNVVTRSTHAVALEEPMHYACALLVASVKAETPTLPDGDGDSRTYALATGHNFPVTGIIIGSQFKQNFDFTPDASGTEYYLYDNQISGVYLTGSWSDDFRTMVFPVPEDMDVYFFLELRNDSNAAFTGAEGLILPGSKFYLAGKLDKSDDPLLPSVFMRDYYTTLKCTVTSLANAHVSVPEMGEPQLTFGVQTSQNWMMSSSAYVVLE